MAADIVFTEGGETVVTAARQVERARIQERQGLDAFEASRRKQEAMALAGAGGLSAARDRGARADAGERDRTSQTRRRPATIAGRDRPAIGRFRRRRLVALRPIGRPEPKPRRAAAVPPEVSTHSRRVDDQGGGASSAPSSDASAIPRS